MGTSTEGEGNRGKAGSDDLGRRLTWLVRASSTANQRKGGGLLNNAATRPSCFRLLPFAFKHAAFLKVGLGVGFSGGVLPRALEHEVCRGRLLLYLIGKTKKTKEKWYSNSVRNLNFHRPEKTKSNEKPFGLFPKVVKTPQCIFTAVSPIG